MKTINYVSIDVGSKEVVVVVIRNGKIGKTKTFDNTPEGHVAIIHYISTNKHQKPRVKRILWLRSRTIRLG